MVRANQASTNYFFTGHFEQMCYERIKFKLLTNIYVYEAVFF